MARTNFVAFAQSQRSCSFQVKRWQKQPPHSMQVFTQNSSDKGYVAVDRGRADNLPTLICQDCIGNTVDF